LALRAADLFAEAKLWPEADSNYQRSVDLAGRTGPVVLAEILYAWGEAYWRRSEFEQAEQRYRRALAEAERDGDNLYIAKMLNSLGSAALNQGNLDDADRCFQRNAAIYQAFGPSLNLAANFAELGTVALYRGDLATAEAYYQRDLALTEKLAPGSPDLAITYNNFGMLLERRKDSARAQQYLQKALSIARLVDPTGIRTGTVLGNLGSVMRDAGQLTRSEICYRRALRMKLRSAPNSLTLADTLGNLGDLAYITGRMAVAERYFKDALTIQQRLAPSGLAIASTLNGLGDIARTAGKTNTALEYYEHAVSIRHTLAPGSKAEAESLASLARLAKYGGQPERATELYEQAVAALDAQTQHLGGGDQVRSDFRAQYVPYYKELAELRVKQRDPTGALEVLERSRARSLLETLAQGNVEIKNGTDPLLRRRESALTQALGAKASYRIRLLTGLHTDDQLDAVNKDIAHIVTELAAVRERLRLDSPAYAILTQAVPLHITEIRKLLDEDTVLLEYSLGSDRSYLWLVTPTSVSVHPLASGPTIEALCRQFYDFLKNRDGWTGNDIRTQERVQSVGVRLSRILLGPVASQIRNKRLLIVGDGALHYIPFSVLPAPNRTFDSGSAQTPLIVEHEIVNLPSASVLDSLRRAQVGRRRPPGEVAVLADAVFSARDQRVIDGNERARKSANAGSLGEDRGLLSRAMRDVGLDRAVSLPRLPFSRHEASLILRVSPASAQMSAMDFKASRATAISDELSQYRIVHFATHAVLDNVHPELSGLVLSLVDEHGNPQNGFLGLEDIYNLRLRADLVVLSACHTGLGKLVNGEGLVGLTRGFMYAGAHRIVSSFWAVDDRGTAELMGRFYQAMERDGMRPAAALRRAQTEMLAQRQWRSPYYWGGFQILGEWN
jgi:CHAT domain-containing protein/tetratricopeptide (TPR) repeat protein